jgi:hypothetical protein
MSRCTASRVHDGVACGHALVQVRVPAHDEIVAAHARPPHLPSAPSRIRLCLPQILLDQLPQHVRRNVHGQQPHLGMRLTVRIDGLDQGLKEGMRFGTAGVELLPGQGAERIVVAGGPGAGPSGGKTTSAPASYALRAAQCGVPAGP